MDWFLYDRDLRHERVKFHCACLCCQNLRQSILFQKIGNGAVIKHEVDSAAEKNVEFFSLCIFGICEEARSRRIRKL